MAAVRDAVRARMDLFGWSDARLADEAGVSYNAVHEWLMGRRDWPRASTRSGIEQALGWGPGSLARIANGTWGADVDEQVEQLRTVNDQIPDATGQRVVLDFPADVIRGMSALDLATARANAEAAYLRTLREVRRSTEEGANPS